MILGKAKAFPTEEGKAFLSSFMFIYFLSICFWGL